MVPLIRMDHMDHTRRMLAELNAAIERDYASVAHDLGEAARSAALMNHYRRTEHMRRCRDRITEAMVEVARARPPTVTIPFDPNRKW